MKKSHLFFIACLVFSIIVLTYARSENRTPADKSSATTEQNHTPVSVTSSIANSGSTKQ